MKIDSDAIKELANLLDETGLNEIEVADGDKAIRVSKGGAMVAAQTAPLAMPSDPAVPQKASLDAPAQTAVSHPGAVKSPMVGTVYLQGEPGAPSFVKKGRQRKRRRYSGDHRGDEGHEPHQGRNQRNGHAAAD